MRTIDDLLADLPALSSLSAEHRHTIASCARNCAFRAGDRIMREGEPADAFYVIREGAVAVETAVPGRGSIVLQTLHEGDLLGWSWLVPPYRVAFDARAVTATQAIAFDGACLRQKSDADPALGYDLLKLVSTVFVERLQDTRLRLLDFYRKESGV
jgi:CRP-like cAMP-binding protein